MRVLIAKAMLLEHYKNLPKDFRVGIRGYGLLLRVVVTLSMTL